MEIQLKKMEKINNKSIVFKNEVDKEKKRERKRSKEKSC